MRGYWEQVHCLKRRNRPAHHQFWASELDFSFARIFLPTIQLRYTMALAPIALTIDIAEANRVKASPPASLEERLLRSP